ncbi:hypothetical protein SAMN04489760_14617 [Syntrophus gentianae]|uniref:Uncharacterized protein n=1 Tax=Syntrophus gentianae TaxID=43775 RepID=A0A1H8B4H3_9BACT|nr:hypothetical protein [Syntrophus gentianae]SEM77811.1 hypothetical protein SAMN04489760_14617 [Syntrophus gentianae]
MECRSSVRKALLGLFCAILLIGANVTGCISLRLEKGAEGRPLPETALSLAPGKATLIEVLQVYGAPDHVGEISEGFVLAYERNAYRGLSLSVGLPLSDTVRTSADMTAHGSLIRYDTLMFFFTKEGVLNHSLLERGSRSPLWKTYWHDP